MQKLTITKTLLLALGLGVSLSVTARERLDLPASTGSNSSGNGNRIAAGCLTSSSSQSLDINNVRAMVLNGGDMWWNLSDARYEVPKVTDPNAPKKHSIFAGSVWIGGKDQLGNLYLSSQTYRQVLRGGTLPQVGYWPGPLDDKTGLISKDECAAWNFHSKVDKALVDKFRDEFQKQAYNTADDLPKAIKDWPGKMNPHLQGPQNMNLQLAPFVNVGGNPEWYEPLEGDYPDFRGDQAIWWVMNDDGNVKVPQSKKIGLELQVLAFAFQTNDLINNMTFYKQTIKNKGGTELKDTYLGQWVDPDLGFYNDDYVGCDVGRGLGICYNGDNEDEGAMGYGLNPPAVGVDFFQGPVADSPDGIDNNRDGVIDEPGEKIIMSSFIYYNNDDDGTNGNPNKASDYYNYLQAIWRDGKLITYGEDGKNQTKDPYKFMFSDDTDPKGYGFSNPPIPNKVPGFKWTEFNKDGGGKGNTPADRRFLQSAGPFTLNMGAVNELTIGVVWARANSGGAQGSLGLLKYADDKAQKLFDNDFKLPQGPDAPEVRMTEMDQQLILTLVPSSFRTSENNSVTTETYFETDNALKNNIKIKDPIYRFEGYKVYQLKDPTVSASELNNVDRARLVVQTDVKNGVTNIINFEFDANVNQSVPKLMVRGSDKGIQHTINITSDLFATGNDRIINFMNYHYMVVAYAYNGDPENKEDQYLEGRKVGIASGIPHKTVVEESGLVLTSKYGTSSAITRIFGTGNGGHVLEITEQDEADILANNSKKDLHYEAGKAPFVVKVYDPKIVKGGEFEVKLASRLLFKPTSSNGIQVGDTIVSTGDYTKPDVSNAATAPNTMASFPQIPGRGIVRGIKDVELIENGKPVKFVELEVEMLNDHLGGTFTASVELYSKKGTGSDAVTTFIDYGTETRPFKNENNPAFNGVASQFTLNDLWKFKRTDEADWKNADRPISEVNEQLLPDYGIAIEFAHGFNPGYQVIENGLNGFLESSITYASDNKWLKGIPNGPFNPGTPFRPWMLRRPTQGSPNTELSNIDPNYNYQTLLGGTWGAYAVTDKAPHGPAYVWTTSANRKLYDLPNVDVVITADKSKWTRVVVIQGTATQAAHQLTKFGSEVLSVGKDGKPDGAMSTYPKGNPKPATSMGWFPGYAIDLDRGIRLNMMFSEFGKVSTQPTDTTDKGRNLIWDPTSDADGGRNFIYVMNTKYDEAEDLSYDLDLAKSEKAGIAAQYRTYIQDSIFNKAMWVGYPQLEKGAKLLATDVRVRIRVSRYFTSYNSDGVYNVRPNNGRAPYTGVNTNPEYRFKTDNLVPLKEQIDVAKGALDLIRVVPNPYYAVSQYEQGQLSNIVKFTNLPKKCKISIYTVNGTLIKTFSKDDSKTYLDWTLKNENNLPIASGVYIVNVDAGALGNKVVKFFGVMKPADLESF